MTAIEVATRLDNDDSDTSTAETAACPERTNNGSDRKLQQDRRQA
jgi:hypothetical protein